MASSLFPRASGVSCYLLRVCVCCKGSFNTVFVCLFVLIIYFFFFFVLAYPDFFWSGLFSVFVSAVFVTRFVCVSTVSLQR